MRRNQGDILQETVQLMYVLHVSLSHGLATTLCVSPVWVAAMTKVNVSGAAPVVWHE